VTTSKAGWWGSQGGDQPVNATARRIGMEWVDETEKYYGLRLQVFRIRPADLDQAVP
jgi:hypothetical protein